MTPTIRVDDEVYALLQQRGEAFVDTPNTVLRRILGLSDSDESTGHPVGRRGGRRGEDRASRKLAKLVADDLLSPDEELVWERRNNGERHTARVGADGTLAPRGRPRGRQPVGRRPPPGGVRGQRLARLAPGRRHPARGPLGSARRRSPRRPPRCPRPRPRTYRGLTVISARPAAGCWRRSRTTRRDRVHRPCGRPPTSPARPPTSRGRRTTGSSCSAAGCCRRGTRT